jgi:hypothetical protein
MVERGWNKTGKRAEKDGISPEREKTFFYKGSDDTALTLAIPNSHYIILHECVGWTSKRGAHDGDSFQFLRVTASVVVSAAILIFHRYFVSGIGSSILP